MPSEPRYKPASHVVEDDFKVGTVQACNRCGVSYIEGYTGDCQEQHCGGSVVSFGDPADVARKMEVAHAEGRAEALGEATEAMQDLSGPIGRARLELGYHESSAAMLEAFSRLRHVLTGYPPDAPPVGWCVCQGNDGTLHKHYPEPPYGCARCSKCKAFQASDTTLDANPLSTEGER